MSVTAVPLQPLPKGTMAKLWLGILFLALLGVGLAWLGTSPLQYSTTESGTRYRVLKDGKGEPVKPDDLIRLDFEIRKADGAIVESSARTGQPADVTVNSFFPGLRDLMLEMREGGIYEAKMSAEKAVGQPIPPGAPVASGDVLDFRLRVASIMRGMGAMQEMMGPGGPGGPGGAVPPGAMPPGAMPPGAGPGGPPPAGPGGR